MVIKAHFGLLVFDAVDILVNIDGCATWGFVNESAQSIGYETWLELSVDEFFR